MQGAESEGRSTVRGGGTGSDSESDDGEKSNNEECAAFGGGRVADRKCVLPYSLTDASSCEVLAFLRFLQPYFSQRSRHEPPGEKLIPEADAEVALKKVQARKAAADAKKGRTAAASKAAARDVGEFIQGRSKFC